MTRLERAFDLVYEGTNCPEDWKNHRVGDDLTPEMLDELHRFWEDANGLKGNHMGHWWKDKAHQIGRRLLMRLTRAEARVKELEAELAALKAGG